MAIVRQYKTCSVKVELIMDNRTYIRVIFDKLLKDNLVFTLFKKFVNFYCGIFSHPLNSLKFHSNIPIKNNNETDVKQSFQDVDTLKDILG